MSGHASGTVPVWPALPLSLPPQRDSQAMALSLPVASADANAPHHGNPLANVGWQGRRGERPGTCCSERGRTPARTVTELSPKWSIGNAPRGFPLVRLRPPRRMRGLSACEVAPAASGGRFRSATFAGSSRWSSPGHPAVPRKPTAPLRRGSSAEESALFSEPSTRRRIDLFSELPVQ